MRHNRPTIKKLCRFACEMTSRFVFFAIGTRHFNTFSTMRTGGRLKILQTVDKQIDGILRKIRRANRGRTKNMPLGLRGPFDSNASIARIKTSLGRGHLLHAV
jgi:hypothetical protein